MSRTQSHVTINAVKAYLEKHPEAQPAGFDGVFPIDETAALIVQWANELNEGNQRDGFFHRPVTDDIELIILDREIDFYAYANDVVRVVRALKFLAWVLPALALSCPLSLLLFVVLWFWQGSLLFAVGAIAAWWFAVWATGKVLRRRFEALLIGVARQGPRQHVPALRVALEFIDPKGMESPPEDKGELRWELAATFVGGATAVGFQAVGLPSLGAVLGPFVTATVKRIR